MKKYIFVSLVSIVMLFFVANFFVKNKENLILTSSTAKNAEKTYNEPIYNKECITNIKTINLDNEKVKNSYQFVFISDLHTSIIDDTEQDEKIKQALVERNGMFTYLNPYNKGGKEVFDEIVKYTNESNSDALLLGGDIIDTPSNSNFQFLRDSLKNLKTEYLYTLGNHDWSFAWDYHTKETQEKYHPKFSEFMDDTQVSFLEYEDLIVLAINDSKNQIDEIALDKIKQVLEKKKPTIIMLHVPLSTEYISKKAIEIRNRVSAIGEYGVKPTETTKKAMDMIFSEDYNVISVLSGHAHFEVEDKLNDKIVENVVAPAYSGNITVIKINENK